MAKLDTLYWELEIREKGVDAATARLASSIKQVDVAAQRATDAVTQLERAESKAAASGQRFATATAAQAKSFAGVGRTVSDALKPEEVRRRLADIDKELKKGVAQGAKSGRELAQSLTKGLRQAFVVEQASIREELARGLITPQQAEQRGRDAALAFNRGVLSALGKAGDAGKLQGAQGQQLFVGLSNQLKNVEASGQKARFSLLRLREPLTSLASHAIGAQAQVGQLATSIASLGLGAGITIGITAGVALIATAIRKITQSSREAKERFKELIDELVKGAKQDIQIKVGFRVQKEQIDATAEELKKRIADINKTLAQPLAGPAQQFRGSLERQRNQAQSQLDRIGLAGAKTQAQIDAEREKTLDEQAQQLGNILSLETATNAQRKFGAELVARYRAELVGIKGTSEGELARADQLNSRIAALVAHKKAQVREDQKAATLAARQRDLRARLTAIVSGDDPIAKARVEIRKFINEMTDAQIPAGELGAAIKALNAHLEQVKADRLEELADALAEQAAALTATGLDDYVEQIRQANEATERQITDNKDLTDSERALALAQLAKVKALQESAKIAIVAGEAVEAALTEIERLTVDGFLSPQELREGEGILAGLQVQLEQYLKTVIPGSKAEKEIKEQLLRIEQERAKLQQTFDQQLAGLFKIGDATGKAAAGQKRHTDAVARHISVVGDAARASLEFASALGSLDAQTQKTLNSIITLGEGIANIFAGNKAQGALQAASSITSLVSGAITGPKHARRQRAQTQAANFESIADIIEGGQGLLGLQFSGKQFSAVQNAVAQLVARQGKAGDFRKVRDGEGFIESLGVPIEKLKEIAASLGIKIDGTVGSWRRLLEAMEATGAGLTGFAGKLRKLELIEKAAGDAVDPFEAMLKRFELLAGPDGAPAFAKALEGLDLTTKEGRAEGLKRLQELVANLDRLKAGDFGDIVPKEFVDQLFDFIDRLRDIDPPPLEPHERFARDLDFLSRRFALLKVPSGDRLKALSELVQKQFPEIFGFLGDGGPLGVRGGLGASAEGIEGLRRRAGAFLEQATADSEISDAEQAILDAFEQIIAAMEAAADEAAQAAEEAARKAEAARAKIITVAQNRIAFEDITDPKAQLDILLAAYREAIPALGDLLDQAEGATLDEKLQNVMKQLLAMGDVTEIAGIPIEELIAALLDLETASDTANAAVQSLASQLSEAFSAIDLDAAIFGTSPGDTATAKIRKLLPDLSKFDLTTQVGRDEVIALLRELAKANADDDDLKRLIADVLRDISALGDGAGGVANITRGVPGETGTPSADGTQRITEHTAIGIQGSLTSIDFRAAVIARLMEELVALVRVGHSLTPPDLPALAAGGGAGGTTVTLTVNQNLFIGAGAGAVDSLRVQQAALSGVQQGFDVIDRQMGRGILERNRTRGSAQIP